MPRIRITIEVDTHLERSEFNDHIRKHFMPVSWRGMHPTGGEVVYLATEIITPEQTLNVLSGR